MSPHPTSRADAVYADAQRVVWKPAVTAPIDEHIASAMSVGSTRIELGPQNGVWVKWVSFRSGRTERTIPGTNAR